MRTLSRIVDDGGLRLGLWLVIIVLLYYYGKFLLGRVGGYLLFFGILLIVYLFYAAFLKK